jgi:hypothetical protein
LTTELVALRMGWETSGGRFDGGRVLKNLGLKPERAAGKTYWWTSLSYERAVELARAMDCDPWEFDL